MSRQRKTFPCSHKGFGRFCHRCDTANRADEERKQRRIEQEELFRKDSIDLRGVPRNRLERCRTILKEISEGRDYRDFGGKKLKRFPNIVSVPLGYDYRIVFVYDEGLQPLFVLTHEHYNNWVDEQKVTLR